LCLFPSRRCSGRQIFLLKRAQIFVADVWGMLKCLFRALHHFVSQQLTLVSLFCRGEGLGFFDDMQQLTMFADYRVPQLLRDLGVLVYSSNLAATVDSCTELLAGSEEETQIRYRCGFLLHGSSCGSSSSSSGGGVGVGFGDRVQSSAAAILPLSH
jgi:hypothetical protein